eukprot:1161195-Pelagomonas_calceolata.AAC.19
MRKNVQLHLASCQWCDKASPHSITTVQLHVRLLLGVGGVWQQSPIFDPLRSCKSLTAKTIRLLHQAMQCCPAADSCKSLTAKTIRLLHQAESGSQDNAPEIETPSMLQAFVQPYEDQRYITTYVNAGTSVTCHTFQRKFSKRYTPMSAASAAQPDTRDADIIAALTPQVGNGGEVGAFRVGSAWGRRTCCAETTGFWMWRIMVGD